MVTDKELKEEFRKRAQQYPEKYYAVSVLKEKGFERGQCKNCGKFFWSVNKRDVCGNANCSGGFTFIGNSPAKNKLGYIEVWKKFSNMFEKFGYKPINRYPVVARWREDVYFVQASIYDFQPYVVTGEIKPPSTQLVVPQFCLRFNDIDNVGVTGAHYTGFVMIGQHAFQPPEKYDQVQYLQDISRWLNHGLGLKDEEIVFHEDAWAGGGNFGPCMEFFSRGLELGNQVYMFFEKLPEGSRELKLKVLDMGMGQERNAWFSNGTISSYEVTFPTVMERLYRISGFKSKTLAKFFPYAAFLNIDEVKEVDKTWAMVAKKININVRELRNNVSVLAALYSIAEHSRTLLLAIADGALPSNVGGGYNLRVILRRALRLIEQHGWKISLAELCELHAKFLRLQYPELRESLKEVNNILDVEEKKFSSSKQRSLEIINKFKGKQLDEKKLVEIYDSYGISPELLVAKIPDNFYAQLAELHEYKKKEEKEKFPFYVSIPDTEKLYYQNIREFKAVVLSVIDDCIMLDKSAFYPTSGGQENDVGNIGSSRIVSVEKHGGVVVHKVDRITVLEGDVVECKVDWERRIKLMQHHTATHIINAVARNLLGRHIWQAGAEKSPDKARLDITHYAQLTDDETKKIEEEANNIIKRGLSVSSLWMPRDRAEKKYGFRLYQGGAVPGKEIRIVEIKNLDVEACGGTHCSNTKEVGRIKILKTSKIQDGVVRIEFMAGESALEVVKREQELLTEIAKLLNVKVNEIPSRCEELFEKWKLSRKGKIVEPLKTKKSSEGSISELLQKAANILQTQSEHVPKTIQRFLKELKYI